MQKEGQNNDAGKHVKSIEKALGIFLLFSEEQPELSHTEIARRMGWTTSTTSRLLGTLLNKSFLVKNPENGKYMLGSIIYYLGRIAKSNTDLDKISAPILNDLRERSDETVHIFVRDGIYRRCYAQAESRQPVRQATQIGTREPVWVGATGLTLLAFQSPELLDKLLSEIKQKHAEVDLDALRLKMAQIRHQGYCVKSGNEDNTHVGCVVAPIFDAGGKVDACLGISTPEYRFPDSPDMFVKLVTSGAGQISQLLGHSGKPNEPAARH